MFCHEVMPAAFHFVIYDNFSGICGQF